MQRLDVLAVVPHDAAAAACSGWICEAAFFVCILCCFHWVMGLSDAPGSHQIVRLSHSPGRLPMPVCFVNHVSLFCAVIMQAGFCACTTLHANALLRCRLAYVPARYCRPKCYYNAGWLMCLHHYFTPERFHNAGWLICLHCTARLNAITTQAGLSAAPYLTPTCCRNR